MSFVEGNLWAKSNSDFFVAIFLHYKKELTSIKLFHIILRKNGERIREATEVEDKDLKLVHQSNDKEGIFASHTRHYFRVLHNLETFLKLNKVKNNNSFSFLFINKAKKKCNCANHQGKLFNRYGANEAYPLIITGLSL